MDVKNSRLFTTPIAHRGLHNEDIPENSLLSFEKAVENGYPIEIDVRIIDDGTVIVFHDDVLGRMTAKDGYASNLRKADLAEIRLNGTDQVIPTLEQTLETANGKVPLLIETKVSCKIGELERKVIDILKSYNGEFAMQSFDPYSMEYFRKNEPDFIRGQLASAAPTGLTLLKQLPRKAQSNENIRPALYFLLLRGFAQQIRCQKEFTHSCLDGAKQRRLRKSKRLLRQHNFRKVYSE